MPDFKLKPPDQQFATAEVAAAKAGISERRLRQLAEAFPAIKDRHGQYNLRQLAKLLKLKKAKALIKQIETAEAAPQGEEPGITAERRKKVRIDREIAEEKLRKMRGEVVSIKTYQEQLTRIFGTIRVHVLNIPRIAGELVGLDAQRMEARLETVCRDVLKQLSNGQPLHPTRDPGEPEQLPAGDGAGLESPGAAPDVHSERVGGPPPLPAQG